MVNAELWDNPKCGLCARSFRPLSCKRIVPRRLSGRMRLCQASTYRIFAVIVHHSVELLRCLLGSGHQRIYLRRRKIPLYPHRKDRPYCEDVYEGNVRADLNRQRRSCLRLDLSRKSTDIKVDVIWLTFISDSTEDAEQQIGHDCE